MDLKPQDMLCFALYTTAQSIQQAYRPLLEPLGLTYPQYLVMTALWAAGEPMTVGEIARALDLESSTITPLLKRLEGQGFIARKRSADDERQVFVSLTKAGREMHEKARAIPSEIGRQTGLTDDDIAHLREDLLSLRAHLDGAAGG